MHRLEPMVHEMERIREPVLIIGHQGVLRVIYAYYMVGFRGVVFSGLTMNVRAFRDPKPPTSAYHSTLLLSSLLIRKAPCHLP